MTARFQIVSFGRGGGSGVVELLFVSSFYVFYPMEAVSGILGLFGTSLFLGCLLWNCDPSFLIAIVAAHLQFA